MTLPAAPPHGPKSECDLVLKGGITSGVAYPGAIIALGRGFRLRNVGGTSAGALGAAVAAAAEFRRQTTGQESFAEPLTQLIEDLGTTGFTGDLLHPTAATRPLMRMLLAGLEQGKPLVVRGLKILGVLLWARAWLVLLTIACSGVLGWLTIAAPQLDRGLTAALVAAIALLAVLVSVLGCAALLMRAVKRSLDAPENGYAMCSGMQVVKGREALTPWLHATIQRIAGLDDPAPPLTFADLAAEDITLAVVTTDLTSGRPLTLPLRDGAAYWFDPADIGRLFPEHVAAHLIEHSTEDPETGLRRLPTTELPVVVAVRMSLSVPLLIAAMPLYGCDRPGKPSRDHRIWLTDGGVTSNFPIKFFDSWVPRRPTFGLDLRPEPGPLSARRATRKLADEDMVVLPPSGHPPSHWHGITGAGGFIRHLLDALMNWRDTAQAQLPGYRDRVCQIRLAEDEGGLNLNMDAVTIAGLNERGRIAGTRLSSRFDEDGWRTHRASRYRLLMGLLQIELNNAGATLAEVDDALREALEREPDLKGSDVALRALVRAAHDWQHGSDRFGFASEDESDQSDQAPILRIGPRT